jgi:hypothetical protein
MKVLTYTRIIINKQDEENIPTMIKEIIKDCDYNGGTIIDYIEDHLFEEFGVSTMEKLKDVVGLTETDVELLTLIKNYVNTAGVYVEFENQSEFWSMKFSGFDELP